MVRHDGCQSTCLTTLHNLILPNLAQPGAFLEDRATCVLLEVVNLAAITRVVQDGSSRRLKIYMSDNIAQPHFTQPSSTWDVSGSLRNLCAA